MLATSCVDSLPFYVYATDPSRSLTVTRWQSSKPHRDIPGGEIAMSVMFGCPNARWSIRGG